MVTLHISVTDPGEDVSSQFGPLRSLLLHVSYAFPPSGGGGLDRARGVGRWSSLFSLSLSCCLETCQ